jgi:hypothetical protein
VFQGARGRVYYFRCARTGWGSRPSVPGTFFRCAGGATGLCPAEFKEHLAQVGDNWSLNLWLESVAV